MGKIAIVTDSNSGITQEEAKELGIRVVPMPFYINGELYYEDITLTQDEFYEKLETGADISTSQPSPGDVMELWEELLEEYDEVIHIPMSSGLSSSCENAIMLAREFEGKVYVVDNQRISVTQRQSVEDAMMMRDKGMSGEEIVDVLMREKLESSIYITVDTLKHTCCRSNRNGTESETGTPDPGRETGCICKSARMEGCKKDNAGCN